MFDWVLNTSLIINIIITCFDDKDLQSRLIVENALINKNTVSLPFLTQHKNIFLIKDFLCKCNQIHKKLRIRSH